MEHAKSTTHPEEEILTSREAQLFLKIGRTIADLQGLEQIRAAHIAEAIQYRSLDRGLT